jgi:hypothetical protein
MTIYRDSRKIESRMTPYFKLMIVLRWLRAIMTGNRIDADYMRFLWTNLFGTL